MYLTHYARAEPGTAAYANESNAYEILSVTGVFGFLALLAVVLRMYVRMFMLKYSGSDDWVMVAAMALGVAVYVCFIGESPYGLGHHLSTLSTEELVMYAKWQFWHSLLVVAAISLVKISISLLLLRLATRTGYRRFLIALIVFLAAFTIASLCTLIFACTPIAAQWNTALLLKGAYCFSNDTFAHIGIFNSVINMVTDVVLAVLPIPVIIKLQVERRVKIALIVVLALGMVACVCGAVKTNYQSTFLEDPDRTWNDHLFIWSALEVYVSILAASLPTLKPLFAAFLTSARTTMGRSGNGTVPLSSHRARHLHSGAFGYEKQIDSVGSNAIPLSQLSTPAPAAQRDNYFAYSGKGFDVKTTCSRTDRNLPLSKYSVDEDEEEEVTNLESSVARTPGIVRTTKVVTRSEPKALDGHLGRGRMGHVSAGHSQNDDIQESEREYESNHKRSYGADSGSVHELLGKRGAEDV